MLYRHPTAGLVPLPICVEAPARFKLSKPPVDREPLAQKTGRGDGASTASPSQREGQPHKGDRQICLSRFREEVRSNHGYCLHGFSGLGDERKASVDALSARLVILNSSGTENAGKPKYRWLMPHRHLKHKRKSVRFTPLLATGWNVNDGDASLSINEAAGPGEVYNFITHR